MLKYECENKQINDHINKQEQFKVGFQKAQAVGFISTGGQWAEKWDHSAAH